MKSFFQVYLVRKICAILSIIIPIISFALFFVFFNSFRTFLKEQKIFLEIDKETADSQQLPIFYGIWIFLSLIWFFQIFVSILIIFNFIKSRNNGDLLLKILFLMVIFVIIGVSILLSFQPQQEKKYVELDNGKYDILVLNKPSYWSGWLIFTLNLFLAIFIIISKRNYGYLKNYKINNKKASLN